MKPQSLAADVRRDIIYEAVVDGRTLDRALRGKPVRTGCVLRIRRALAARGLAHLLPGSIAPKRNSRARAAGAAAV